MIKRNNVKQLNYMIILIFIFHISDIINDH